MNKEEKCFIPIVILAGGKGIFIDESGERLAKGEADIGKKSLLEWIILRYCQYDFKQFIVSGGYRLHFLRDKLLKNYRIVSHEQDHYFLSNDTTEFSVRFVDSGIDTATGERLKAVLPYLTTDVFGVTYSDSYALLNIAEVYAHFQRKNKLAMLVGARLKPRFRALGIRAGDSLVRGFSDCIFMPNHLINGGYYFFKKAIFDLPIAWKTLETNVLEKLIEMHQLDSYIFDGDFCALDCERDLALMKKIILNSSEKG